MIHIALLRFFRERVPAPKDENADGDDNDFEKRTAASVATTLESPPGGSENGPNKGNYSARSLLKSASISASKCIGVKGTKTPEVYIHYPLVFLVHFLVTCPRN